MISVVCIWTGLAPDWDCHGVGEPAGRPEDGTFLGLDWDGEGVMAARFQETSGLPLWRRAHGCDPPSAARGAGRGGRFWSLWGAPETEPRTGSLPSPRG